MEEESKQIAELKELVRRNIEITKETREEVAKMHRSARWGRIVHWSWRLFIFGTFFFGYYYFIQPYVDQLLHTYQNIRSGAEQTQSFGTKFSDFLKGFGQ